MQIYTNIFDCNRFVAVLADKICNVTTLTSNQDLLPINYWNDVGRLVNDNNAVKSTRIKRFGVV